MKRLLPLVLSLVVSAPAARAATNLDILALAHEQNKAAAEYFSASAVYHSKYLAQDCAEATQNFKGYVETLVEFREWLKEKGEQTGGGRRAHDARLAQKVIFINRLKMLSMASAQKMGYIEARLAYPSSDTAFNRLRLEIGLNNVERAMQEANKETRRMSAEGRVTTDNNGVWAQWSYTGTMPTFRAKWDAVVSRAKASTELSDEQKKTLDGLIAEAAFAQPNSVPAE